MTDQTNTNELHLFFDTETSGFISNKKTFNDPAQAWCCQIGAILSTRDEIISKLNVLIKPAGRSMNYHAEQVHGYSLEKLEKEGIDELEAIELFANLMLDSPKKICHNYDFDWKYIYQMFQRNQDKLTDSGRSVFYLDLPHVCTMKSPSVIKYCDLKNVYGKPKWPKLYELHMLLFEKDFTSAHDAFADIEATRRCYYELIAKGII